MIFFSQCAILYNNESAVFKGERTYHRLMLATDKAELRKALDSIAINRRVAERLAAVDRYFQLNEEASPATTPLWKQKALACAARRKHHRDFVEFWVKTLS